MNKYLAIGIIVAASIAVYLNSLHAPFFFDDLTKIVENPDIRSLGNLKTKLVYRYDAKDRDYTRNDPSRPVVYLTFTLNYWAGRLEPSRYRAVNILIHAANAVLLFLLFLEIITLLKLPGGALPALLAGLLFAVHPVNTEAVTYVYQRCESLMTLFLLAVLFLYIKGLTLRSCYFLSVLAFPLALFTKQNSAILPALILALDFIIISGFNLKELEKRKYRQAVYWVVLLSFIVWRKIYFGEFSFIEGRLKEIHWTYYTYFITQFYVLVKYIKLLVLPLGQCIQHFVLPSAGIAEPRILLSFFMLLMFVPVSVLCYLKKTAFSKLFLFSIFWFFIAQAPTSWLFALNDAMYERRIYVSSAGFFLAVSALYFIFFQVLTGISLKKNVALMASVSLFCLHFFFLVFLTVRRNAMYNEPFMLWQEAVKRYPGNYNAHNNLGVGYAAKKEYEKALQEFNSALLLRPDFVMARKNIGKLYLKNNDAGQALAEYDEILKAHPADPQELCDTASLYMVMNDYEKAALLYSRSIEVEPGFPGSYIGMGNIFFAKHKYEEAVRQFNIALEKDPGNSEAHINLGILHSTIGEYDQAVRKFEKAIELNPESAEAHYSLGLLYRRSDRFDKALKEYQEALMIRPDYPEARLNLGNLYYLANDYQSAKREYQEALRLSPSNPSVHFNLGLLYQATAEFAASEKEYQAALALNPGDALVREKLKEIKKLLKNR